MTRTDSRDYEWYALCCAPQRELAAGEILSREGFATFVPVAKEMRFANGAARARWQKREVEIPLMPRYVLIGMSDATPGWPRVFAFMRPSKFRRKLITGIIGADDKPQRIRHESIRPFMLRHASGEFNAPSYHAFMATSAEFAVGDEVSPREGFKGKVINIDGPEAWMETQLTGS